MITKKIEAISKLSEGLRAEKRKGGGQAIELNDIIGCLPLKRLRLFFDHLTKSRGDFKVGGDGIDGIQIGGIRTNFTNAVVMYAGSYKRVRSCHLGVV